MTPQSVNAFGGFKVQGKDLDTAQNLIAAAHAFEEAGAFAITLECVPVLLAKKITEELSIPTIGIGAGAYCDGQVLVVNDMLGMFKGHIPKLSRNLPTWSRLSRKRCWLINKRWKRAHSRAKNMVLPSRKMFWRDYIKASFREHLRCSRG